MKRLVLLAAVFAVAPAASRGPAGEGTPAAVARIDFALERIVRAAYTGAAAFARDNHNYFARDGVFAPLREAVVAELQGEGVTDTLVGNAPAESFERASACLDGSGYALRMLSNFDGDGLDLVAVSATRMFAYRYDPHEDASIRLVGPRDCRAAD